MIRPDHPSLSIVRQCRLMSIGRSTFYHVPKGESPENLGLMGKIDRQFLETPFYGARQMTWHLHSTGEGIPVSGGDHGLVEPQGSGVATVEHHGRAVLRRCAG